MLDDSQILAVFHKMKPFSSPKSTSLPVSVPVFFGFAEMFRQNSQKCSGHIATLFHIFPRFARKSWENPVRSGKNPGESRIFLPIGSLVEMHKNAAEKQSIPGRSAPLGRGISTAAGRDFPANRAKGPVSGLFPAHFPLRVSKTPAPAFPWLPSNRVNKSPVSQLFRLISP